MGERIMRAADDLHVHLRDDVRTNAAIKAVRHGGTARVLAMPNTLPPVLTGNDAQRYGQWLTNQGLDVPCLTTIKLTAASQPETVAMAKGMGVVAAKLYPQGVTTNSEDGLRDPLQLAPVFAAMQEVDLVLSLHGEVPGAFVLDAEAEYLPHLRRIQSSFPRLRIVLEHITSKAAVEFVQADRSGGLAASITDHHLALTLNDVVGSRVQPHHFCMPVAKRPSDLKALLKVVASGDSRFFSGTDSAPHLPREKESECGCAGIFNAPFHMQTLASIFARQQMLDRLPAFTSEFGAAFYGLERNSEEVALIESPFRVPDRFDGLIPFLAGQQLAFQISWV